MAQMTSPTRPESRLNENFRWTPRQREVLELITRGYSNARIAEHLGVSLDGAKWHVSEIMSKLGVDSREEAADYWRVYNGFPARFSRIFYRIGIGGGLLRIVAGTATVALVATVAVAVLAIVRSGDDSTPGVEPAATPTVTDPDLSQCPVDDATCTDASFQFLYILSQSVDLLLGQSGPDLTLLEYGRPEAPISPSELGELVNEFMSYSDAARTDSIGSGEARIDSIACPAADPGCSEALGLGLTVIRPDGQRLFLLLTYSREQVSSNPPNFRTQLTGAEYGRYGDRTLSAWTLAPWRDDTYRTSLPAVGAPCPVDDARCNFAREVLDLVRAGNVEPLLAAAEPEMLECAEHLADDPICQGVPKGDSVPVFYAGDRSGEGRPVTAVEFGARLGALASGSSGDAGLRDGYGSGELQLAAIQCTVAAGETGPCPGDFSVVMTWLEPGTYVPVRRALALSFSMDESGTPHLRSFTEPSLISTLPHALYGGEIETTTMDNNPITLTWYPWRPQ